MNWITLIGIVVIAIGTFLTYWGSTIESKKDKSELDTKLEEFDNKLEAVLDKDIPAKQKEGEVEKIKSEYTEWAENFFENKDQLKINYKKQNLGLEETKLRLHKEWSHFYRIFFNDLESIIKAYNSHAINKIKILEKRKLPSNVFESSKEDFYYLIKFSDDQYWKIVLYVVEPIDYDKIPSLEIYQMRNKNDITSAFPDLEIDLDLRSNKFILNKRRNFKTINLTPKETINNLDSEIREIVSKIIEFQIIESEKK